MATLASAALKKGEVVPSFSAEDLQGQTHRSQEWRGRRTLLVVLTDKDGGEAMRRWFDEAAALRVPDSVHRASLLSFKLPFFVGLGTAREKARKKVPEAFWSDTWLDKDGAMGKKLALASSRTPYAFALDEEGRVLAAVHGEADSPEAKALLELLTRP
ncbi:peroxiredoxin family protein [Myxococcus fulvus]|uniref:peroxiredoxin family protein n=1 Tax=Myxococcus fulvus TaxID=33 RepID=UPI003B9917A7